jgi:hypothetical protein
MIILYYEDDVSPSDLYMELTDYVLLKKSTGMPTEAKSKLAELLAYGRDSFPAASAAYRLLLTIGFSVASCERSFSKLKLIKTYLRSTMAQERLTNLALLSIEHKFVTEAVKKRAVELFISERGKLGFRH